MQVCLFCAGRRRTLQAEATDAAKIIAEYSRLADQGRDLRRFLFGQYCAGPTNFVETQVIVPPNGRSYKITHTLAHREKSEPDTLFICVLFDEEYDELTEAARTAARLRDIEIRQRVEAMRAIAPTEVRWQELSPSHQARFRDADLTPQQCWNWRPLPNRRRRKLSAVGKRGDAAPYRRFYIQIMGPIPAGVTLRHTCHNRMCMNPNHLIPGTHPENMRDMTEAGRHAKQVLAKKKRLAKRRAAYRRQKRRNK